MKIKNRLLVQQMDRRMDDYKPLSDKTPLPKGWVYAIRKVLGMSLQQLADRLGVSRQNVSLLEKREAEGTITIKRLRDMAAAMDMELVYGMVPKDKTLQALIEKKARYIAKEIVSRTHRTMVLEDQEVSYERLAKNVEEKTQEIINEMPKYIWDH